MTSKENGPEQITESRSSPNLLKIGASLIACTALVAGITSTQEPGQRIAVEESVDFDVDEFLSNAVISNVVGYSPEDVGIISAGIQCLGSWDNEKWEFAPSNETSEWGKAFVDRIEPEAWTMIPDTYDGHFQVAVGDEEQGSWFWDTLAVEMHGATATLEFYDSNFAQEDTINHTFEPNEVIGGSYRMAEYAMSFNDGTFTLALACNEENTIGYMNRAQVIRPLAPEYLRTTIQLLAVRD